MELLELVTPARQTAVGQDSIGEFVTDALRRAAKAFVERDTDRTPASRDPEDLHQARVALRRIRSYLRTFRIVVDPSFAGAARADLGWFGSLLGEVRNLDVLSRRICTHEDLADPAALDELQAAVAFARNEAVFRVAEARVMPRYATVLSTIDGVAQGKVPLSDSSSGAITPALGRLLQRSQRNVTEAARAARRGGGEGSLHVLRIRSKELRYAAELSAEVLGGKARRVARAAQSVQDRLGEHRDALAAAAFMARAASDRPICAFLSGQVAVIEHQAAARCIEGIDRDLAQLRHRWRALERALRR